MVSLWNPGDLPRWLELEEEEYLICEGDADIDRRIRGGIGESEQVKYRADRFDKRDLQKVLAGFRDLLLSGHKQPGMAFVSLHEADKVFSRLLYLIDCP